MILLVDARYVFGCLLSKSLSEQRKIFATEEHIGAIIPMNAYVLLFDTLIRVISSWELLLTELERRYDLTYIAYYNSENLRESQRYFYHYKYHEKISYKDFRFEVKKSLFRYSHHPQYFHEHEVKAFDMIREVFAIDDVIEPDDDDLPLSVYERNKLIKNLIHLFGTYQTVLTPREERWIYKIWLSMFKYRFDDICMDGALVMTEERNKKMKDNAEVIDFSMNIIKTIKTTKKIKRKMKKTKKSNFNNSNFVHNSDNSNNYDYSDDCKIELTELTKTDRDLTELTKLKTIVDEEFLLVLAFTDANLFSILDDIDRTYIEYKPSMFANALNLPKSFTKCKYENFKSVFEKCIGIIKNEKMKRFLLKII